MGIKFRMRIPQISFWRSLTTLKYCWRFGRWKNRLSHSATSGLQYFLLPVDYSIFYYQWITVFSATSGLQYFLPPVDYSIFYHQWITVFSATSGLQYFLPPVDYSIFCHQWITIFSATSGLQYFSTCNNQIFKFKLSWV